MEHWRERGRRHSLRMDASATRASGSDVPVILTDLSLDGCCLIGAFQIGERITVAIPKVGKLAAEIRWSFMGRAGARFVTETKRRVDERGAAAIEYALLAACIALALVASIARVGTGVGTSLNAVDTAVGSGMEFHT